jgi:hypothetical protein
MESNEIIALLKSPTFWFATVLVNLLVSVASNYLYSKFLSIWANLSIKQANKNAAQKSKYEKLVADIYKSGVRISDMEIHSMYLNIWNLLYILALLICAIFLNSVVAGSLLLKGLSIIVWLGLLFVTNKSINIASYDRKLINAVRNYKPNSSQDADDKINKSDALKNNIPQGK